MLGAFPPKPSEDQAKKKYMKKLNVCHHRVLNEGMAQLRDAFRNTCAHQRGKPKPMYIVNLKFVGGMAWLVVDLFCR